MLTDRELKKAAREQEAKKLVTAARVHWLEQLLDWPLKDGRLVERLTKTEVEDLRQAAEQGKLFVGVQGQSD